MTSLETGYRKLLAWYPRAYRQEYEEELVGVLLAASEDGRRRPGVREAADLLLGAVRVRLRGSFGRAARARWREAAATAGAALAALMLIMALPNLVYHGLGNLLGSPDPLTVIVPATTVLMAAGVWAGRRTLTVFGAWATLAGTAAAADLGVDSDPAAGMASYESVAVALVAALLLSVPVAPRSGLELMRSHGLLLWCLSSGLVLAAAPWFVFSEPTELWPLTVLVPLLYGWAAGTAAWSPVGRRTMLLLAVPLGALITITSLTPAITFVGPFVPTDLAAIVVPVIAFAVTAWWRRPRRTDGGGPDETPGLSPA
ncbi:hypothetical protein SMC26_16525 [Actinomadura fulvescens]|uniref:Integral membrane protein n=1 Tax=Actinomadura fulvescens TaxID=46160 RepID=A0ABP6BW30_9ACTN